MELLRLILLLSLFSAFGGVTTDGGPIMDPNGGETSDAGVRMDPNGGTSSARLCYTGCVDPNG